MLSLQDIFSKEEVQDFVKSMQETLVDPVFVVEYKIDGLSMALRYENGLLTTAITRGDGIIQGEDVTVNAKVIKDVKNKLKEPIEYLEVRGEVYMTNEAFDKVNEIQELNNKKTFANPWFFPVFLSVGGTYIFGFFALIALGSLIFAIKLPETKDKSLEQIQKELVK